MIVVGDLYKEFNGFEVLKDVSFKLNKGERMLVLGPNGSGKTTLFRCIVGLLRFEGKIEIDGYDVRRQGRVVKRLIGYVPQILRFPYGKTARQILELHAAFHDVELDVEELLGKFGLEDVVDVPVSEFSGGMKQRFALAMAISHNPKILIFDEPLANLDFEGRQIFLKLLRRFKEEEKTLLISAHRISDILFYTDKVLILHEGEVIYYGSLEDLLEKIKTVKFCVRVEKPGIEIARDVGRVVERSERWVMVETDDFIDSMRVLASSGLEVGYVFIEEPALDAIVMRLKEGAER